MHFSRREFFGAAIGSLALAFSPRQIHKSPTTPRTSVNELLIEMERRACLFFYEHADPVTGLVKDRARHTGSDTPPDLG
jgi:hypothetical protein